MSRRCLGGGSTLAPECRPSNGVLVLLVVGVDFDPPFFWGLGWRAKQGSSAFGWEFDWRDGIFFMNDLRLLL